MGLPKFSSRIGKAYSQREGLQSLCEKKLLVYVSTHTLFTHLSYFTYFQMSYTLCDFFLWVLA